MSILKFIGNQDPQRGASKHQKAVDAALGKTIPQEERKAKGHWQKRVIDRMSRAAAATIARRVRSYTSAAAVAAAAVNDDGRLSTLTRFSSSLRPQLQLKSSTRLKEANYKQADHNRAVHILNLHQICHYSCECVLRLLPKTYKILSIAASARSARLLGMYLDKAFSECPLFVIIHMISEEVYQNIILNKNVN